MVTKQTMDTIKSNPKMTNMLNIYMENDMRKLKNICHKIWRDKVDVSDYDDLYDVAIDCLVETICSFNEEKSTKFNTFLIGNIMRKSNTWIRDNKYRLKKNNLLKDENGRIIYAEDSNGKKTPVIIQNIFLDMDCDETLNIKNTLKSKKCVEDVVFAEEYTDKVTMYINMLPIRVREVARLFSQEYKQNEIMEILNITEKQLIDSMKILKSYEYISLLFD